MANIKVEKIDQSLGFGNDTPNLQEHYLSIGFSKARFGTSNNKTWYDRFDSRTGYTGNGLNLNSMGVIGSFVSAYAHDNSGGGGKNQAVLACDSQGYIYQSQLGFLSWVLTYPAGMNSSQFDGQASQQMILDQKDRMLYSGKTHIGMMDASISDVGVSFSATNGSNTLTGTGFDNSGAWTKRLIRVFSCTPSGAPHYQYIRINNVSSTTSMTIFGSWPYNTSASHSGFVLMAYNDYWKDWGTTLGFDPATGNYYASPCDTYEDTVMWGRANNIATLNTVTDTTNVTAFTLPTGFTIKHIHSGSNGVLIGGQYQGRGVLVLWDNYSDRSIAPWIRLTDAIVSMCKDGTGQWVIRTAKEIYITNGYTLTLEKRNFLDKNIIVDSPYAQHSQTMVAQSGKVISGFGTSYLIKGKSGAYQYDFGSKLFDYLPQYRCDFKNTTLYAVHYDTWSKQFFAGFTIFGWGSVITTLLQNSPHRRSYFITEEVGQGDNVKVGQGLQLDLGFTDPYYVLTTPLTFTLVVKYRNMSQLQYNYGQVKTDMTLYNQMVVDETFFGAATVGDEIEFSEGDNAGCGRNITAISGAGTATATYTFDRAFPALGLHDHSFSRTKFQLVRVKQFTSYAKMPKKDELYFNLKDNPVGKKFQFKIEILDCNIPLELKPSQFIYDDTGTI